MRLVGATNLSKSRGVLLCLEPTPRANRSRICIKGSSGRSPEGPIRLCYARGLLPPDRGEEFAGSTTGGRHSVQRISDKGRGTVGASARLVERKRRYIRRARCCMAEGETKTPGRKITAKEGRDGWASRCGNANVVSD